MERGKGALGHLRGISELIEIVGDATGCFESLDAKVDANRKT
jgi:hypothetical protein